MNDESEDISIVANIVTCLTFRKRTYNIINIIRKKRN